MKELLVLLFPHDAVMEKTGMNIPLPGDLAVLDNSGDFCGKLSRPDLATIRIDDIPLFFCDTTWTFRRDKARRLSYGMLAAVGKTRAAAMSAVDGIRRALEVGVIWELRKRHRDDLILNDGPLARMMFSMYARLAFRELEGVSEGDPEDCFELLRKVVGLVKDVTIVPVEHLDKADVRHIPVFRLKRPIKGEGEPEERERIRAPFEGVLSCFCLLRPELVGLVPRVASKTGGLVRIDVPIAAILDRYDEGWMSWDFGVDLSRGSDMRERLERILAGIVIERLPFPGTGDPHRILVELAATEITERLLKSALLPKEVVRAQMRELIFS